MTTRVLVDNRVRIELRDLPEGVAKLIREEFTHQNPKAAMMRKAKIKGWWNEPAIIATWEESDGVLSIPRGGMRRFREIMKGSREDFVVRDARVKFEPDPSVPDSALDPREYQLRIVRAGMEKENCLAKSGTGSGKTSALLYLYSMLKVPTLVLVHQIGLAEQWIERAFEDLGLPAEDVGLLGDGQKRIRHLTVSTPQSATNAMKKDPGFARLWGAVFFDEVHLAAARTMFQCVDQFPAQYRVGASDDQKRKDRMEFLIHDIFGDVGAEVTDEELVDGGFVFGVEVLVVPSEFEAEWYSAPAEGADKTPDFGVLVREMAEDEKRQALIDRILASELAEGRQIMVFAKEREHCRSLGTMAAKRAASGYLIGGADYKDEFKRAKKGMKKGEVRVAVGTYQACGVALDIPSVEVGICASPVLSNKTTFRQARGRICRKPAGKTVARLYVIWDRAVFGLRHLENAARWNPKTFVWDGAGWVPVREYLKRERIAAKEE